jgi:transcription initiation factor TFIID subunit 12
LQLHLERNWNIRIPGFNSSQSTKPYKKPQMTDVHKQRLTLVKRTIAQLQKNAGKDKKKDLK